MRFEPTTEDTKEHEEKRKALPLCLCGEFVLQARDSQPMTRDGTRLAFVLSDTGAMSTWSAPTCTNVPYYPAQNSASIVPTPPVFKGGQHEGTKELSCAGS